MMKVMVRKSRMVIPAMETPRRMLWISNLDLSKRHVHPPMVYFYRPTGAVNFFDPEAMKDALSRVLVEFYPIGGRLKEGKDGRIHIDCRGQGVLFVEAESNSVIDDFGDFAPTLDLLKLIPIVDYSLGFESLPLMISQVTYFKCGGVSLGIGMHHFAVDASSLIHFVNSWSQMARGLDLTLSPFVERTLFRARNPPQLGLEHVEYNAFPIKPPFVAPSEEPVSSIFKLTREQLNMLKLKSKEDGNTINYSTIVLLMGHIWKCVCKARGVPYDQETMLYVATDVRVRHEPALPPGYLGNAVLRTFPSAVVGEIISNPSWYAAKKIRDELANVNNDYIKSVIDYLELQPDQSVVLDGMNKSCKDSNLAITSLAGFPIYDADFGWGRPVFMGPCKVGFEGQVILLPSPIKDGSLSIIILLQAEHMKLFSKLLYEIFITTSSMPSNL